MRLGALGQSGRCRLSKSDLSLYDGFDSQDFYNWNSLVRSDAFKRYQKEEAQGPLGLAKGYEIGFYRAVPVTPPEKAPRRATGKLKVAGAATAGLVGAGAAYVMLSDSDGDGVPNVQELFGEKPTMPAPYVIVDKDLDGLPDDLEEKWGYSTSEKDVRLKYWVQNPEENKALVDAALEKVMKDYRERNPLGINIHTYYGGEIPADVSYGNDKYFDFLDSTKAENSRFAKFLIDEYHKPTGKPYDGNIENAFFVRGYYLDEYNGEIAGGGGIKYPAFDVLTRNSIGEIESPENIAFTTMHEMGHGMGLDHSANPRSLMNTNPVSSDFVEDEWAFLTKEPLFDFRPNPIVAKYVPE